MVAARGARFDKGRSGAGKEVRKSLSKGSADTQAGSSCCVCVCSVMIV